MNFLFAWRYFKSKKTTNVINIIAWISVLAIGVGTAALIVVLSVFNGFENIVKNLYGDFYSDMKVTAAKGKFITINDTERKKISSVRGVNHVSYFTEERAVLVNGDYQGIVILKGVDENYTSVSSIITHIERGDFRLGNTDTPYIVPGTGISNAVGADPENHFSIPVIYLPNRKATSFNSLDAMRSYNVLTSGVFSVQQEFDDKYAFTNLAFMQYMLDLDSAQYSGAEISITPGADADEVKSEVQQLLGKNFIVQTRFEQNQSLFTIMQMEKWVIYGILSLILVVAAFNMIGALTMLVLEKRKDIAVLKAMGAHDKRINNIFLSEGLLLAIIGGGSGMLLAYIICFLQLKFKIVKLSGSTFIIDYYPVQMQLTDFLLVAATVFFVALLASWIPSRKATEEPYSLKS